MEAPPAWPEAPIRPANVPVPVPQAISCRHREEIGRLRGVAFTERWLSSIPDSHFPEAVVVQDYAGSRVCVSAESAAESVLGRCEMAT